MRKYKNLYRYFCDNPDCSVIELRRKYKHIPGKEYVWVMFMPFEVRRDSAMHREKPKQPEVRS